MKQVTAFALLLGLLCGCEESSIMKQPPPEAGQGTTGSARFGSGSIIVSEPSLPPPTIVSQTYIPTNSFFTDMRCRAWRISWPTYPVGTSPNLIPTMFSVASGTPYSINFLNKTQPANTFKTSFNLYDSNKLASVSDMWEELTHVNGNVNELELVWFRKSKYPISSVETWVKGRPQQFGAYWMKDAEDNVESKTEMVNYQKDDLYLFKLQKQNRYGGIRIVSVSPRIIEVYLAEPNK